MTRIPVRLTPQMRRRICAFHEAGHTAAAIVEGASVPCAVLNVGDEWKLGHSVGGRTLVEWPGFPVAVRARVWMAGPTAENLAAARVLVPLKGNYGEDYARHAAAITEGGGDAEQAARDARTILEHEWRFVLALTDELNRAGVIDQRGITALAVRTMRGDARRQLNQR